MSEDTVESPCVFLVDDDPVIRTALSRALGLRGYAVRSFASARAFLDGYDPAAPGCLILDYGMPGMDGLELQRHLLNAGIAIPVIFITGHGGVPETVQAMKMGAVDFLEKPFKQSILVDRIDAAFEADRRSRNASHRSHEIRARCGSLTEREREIARIMVTNTARSSSKDIARQLGISPRTVDHHRARILEKMEVASVAELVEAAVKAGLFRDP